MEQLDYFLLPSSHYSSLLRLTKNCLVLKAVAQAAELFRPIPREFGAHTTALAHLEQNTYRYIAIRICCDGLDLSAVGVQMVDPPTESQKDRLEGCNLQSSLLILSFHLNLFWKLKGLTAGVPKFRK